MNQTPAETGGGAASNAEELLLRSQAAAQLGGQGRLLAPISFPMDATNLALAVFGAFAPPPPPQQPPPPQVQPPVLQVAQPPAPQMAPPPSSRPRMDHPSVMQFEVAKVVVSEAGVPKANDAFSWATFSRQFNLKETPYPADDTAASLLAERLGREAAAFVSSFKLLRSVSTCKSSGKNSVRAEPYAGHGASSSAPVGEEMGDGGRAASPAP